MAQVPAADSTFKQDLLQCMPILFMVFAITVLRACATSLRVAVDVSKSNTLASDKTRSISGLTTFVSINKDPWNYTSLEHTLDVSPNQEFAGTLPKTSCNTVGGSRLT